MFMKHDLAFDDVLIFSYSLILKNIFDFQVDL